MKMNSKYYIKGVPISGESKPKAKKRERKIEEVCFTCTVDPKLCKGYCERLKEENPDDS